jgi:hypothetical protein
VFVAVDFEPNKDRPSFNMDPNLGRTVPSPTSSAGGKSPSEKATDDSFKFSASHKLRRAMTCTAMSGSALRSVDFSTDLSQSRKTCDASDVSGQTRPVARSMSRRISSHVIGRLGFAEAHLRAKDISHVNTGVAWLELVHRVVYGHPALVLFFFLIIYVGASLTFAGILYALGPECFKLEGEFAFASTLWISVHAFSTIGFGNIAPLQSCAPAQIVILLESFVSLLVVSAIGG